jgi:hypothetical protein
MENSEIRAHVQRAMEMSDDKALSVAEERINRGEECIYAMTWFNDPTNQLNLWTQELGAARKRFVETGIGNLAVDAYVLARATGQPLIRGAGLWRAPNAEEER